MIQTILSFFGYTKIPKAVIQLSLLQEIHIEKWCRATKKHKGWHDEFESYLKAQKTITRFLQSGRLLT